MAKKKEKKEPQYIASKMNTPMLNYRVYYMTAKEKLINALLAFVVGGLVGLVFYGGQFRDAAGAATTATAICNAVVFVLVGLVAVKLFMPMRTEQLKAARKRQLLLQFRSFLESLAVALSTGMNMKDSVDSTREDLVTAYGTGSYIVAEVDDILAGLRNNVPIEDTVRFLGERSGIDDIKNFAVVFSISYRAGGNLKDIVRRTNGIISDKIDINEQIETAITSNKSQFTTMMIIPVVLVLLLRVMSSQFAASFATPVGIFAITIAIAIFVAAYKMGQKIMDVKG